VNAINTFFGTSSYKKVDTGSTGESTEYYESKYNNINSMSPTPIISSPRSKKKAPSS
jgi:hypothetical protein